MPAVPVDYNPILPAADMPEEPEQEVQQWAIADIQDPISKQWNKEAPLPEEANTGFLYNQGLDRQTLNYLFNNHGTWLAHLRYYHNRLEQIANQDLPAASADNAGYMYFSTTLKCIVISNGANWQKITGVNI